MDYDILARDVRAAGYDSSLFFVTRETEGEIVLESGDGTLYYNPMTGNLTGFPKDFYASPAEIEAEAKRLAASGARRLEA